MNLYFIILNRDIISIKIKQDREEWKRGKKKSFNIYHYFDNSFPTKNRGEKNIKLDDIFFLHTSNAKFIYFDIDSISSFNFFFNHV